MIPLVDRSWQGQPWQWQLANAITDINELACLLAINIEPGHSEFPLLVPRAFLSRIEAGNPDDPLLKQVLPVSAERTSVPGFGLDPVGDGSAVRQLGMLQKYQGRVLVITTGACAVNCRYCFRRHFPYGDFQPDSEAWEAIFDSIADDPKISEVILSGGDPLVMSDRRLRTIASRIEAIDHVTTIRLHTRLPIVIPDRITPEFLEWIRDSHKQVVVVLHANHPNEIDEDVAGAAHRLREAGAFLLNQSVLLADINDSAGTLAELSRRLFSVGVMPYYLHQLDRVAGAAHFGVTDQRALALLDEIRTMLPGYLVPELVQEIEGAESKVPLISKGL